MAAALSGTVLVTRALEQGQMTARRLLGLGYMPVVAPLTRVDIAQTAPRGMTEGVQAILITSQNGAIALKCHVGHVRCPVLAVGDSTADVLRNDGFVDVRSAGGDALALSALALASLDPHEGVVLHVRGEHMVRSPLVALQDAGFVTREAVLYRTVDCDGFGVEIIPALHSVAVALVYSPGSARRLRIAAQSLPDGVLAPSHIIGISAAALRPLEDFGRFGDTVLHVAKTPDETAMMACLGNTAKNPVDATAFHR